MKRIVLLFPLLFFAAAHAQTVLEKCQAGASYGGFGFQSSLLLGIGFTIVFLWLYELVKLAAFEPYKAVVGVKFAALRDDLGLVSATNEEQFENYSFTAILRHGTDALRGPELHRDHSETLSTKIASSTPFSKVQAARQILGPNISSPVFQLSDVD